MNGGSRTPGVPQPLWKCWFQPGRVSSGENVFDGNERYGKKWRGASRQTRLKRWALLWASHTLTLPLPRAGETTSPQTRGLLSESTWNWAAGAEEEADAGLSNISFPKKAHFQSSPLRDVTYYTPQLWLNTTCRVWNFPLFCACAMTSRKQKKKKENTPDFKKICVRAKCISDPVKDKLSPSDSTWKRFNQSVKPEQNLLLDRKTREKVWNCSAPPPPPHISC